MSVKAERGARKWNYADTADAMNIIGVLSIFGAFGLGCYSLIDHADILMLGVAISIGAVGQLLRIVGDWIGWRAFANRVFQDARSAGSPPSIKTEIAIGVGKMAFRAWRRRRAGRVDGTDTE